MEAVKNMIMSFEKDFTSEHDEILFQLYSECDNGLDCMAYTDQWMLVYANFIARTGRVFSVNDVWRRAMNLRKNVRRRNQITLKKVRIKKVFAKK